MAKTKLSKKRKAGVAGETPNGDNGKFYKLFVTVFLYNLVIMNEKKNSFPLFIFLTVVEMLQCSLQTRLHDKLRESHFNSNG